VWQKVTPVVVADFILLVFFDLLASTKIENVASRRERETLLHRKLSEEIIKTQETIKAKREAQSKKETKDEQDKGLVQKKQLLELYKQTYVEVFAVRFKRDVPKLLERMLAERLGARAGIVLETSEDLKEIRIRSHWGLSAGRSDPMTAIAAHKDSRLMRRAAEKREPICEEDCRKDLPLLEAYTKFCEDLFRLTWALPVVAGDKTAFVVFLGPQVEGHTLPLDLNVIRPIIAAIGVVLIKIGAKDARPSFSTFLPGS
jgi:hypothetical protein